MSKFAYAAAAAAMVVTFQGAAAADLSYKGSMKDAPYEAPPAAIWSGYYVGGHLGGLWNDNGDNVGFSKWKRQSDSYFKETNCIKFENEDNNVDFIGGVHVGYNWQNGVSVYGLEGDVSFADGLDYLASFRARLGYAVDNFLLYATAGVAFAGFDNTSINTTIHGYPHTFSFDGDSKVGAVVGAGVEYKVSANWSVGVEGLYYAFGDSNDSDQWDYYCKTFKVDHNDDNNLFVVRGRITYHFLDAYEAPLK